MEGNFPEPFPPRIPTLGCWSWCWLPSPLWESLLGSGGFPSFPPVDDGALQAVLTAIPATLGTLFVLAFTFTLVTAQIASNYSHILFRRVLGPWVLWYAVPFGIGILLPLYLLNGHFYLWAVEVSPSDQHLLRRVSCCLLELQ